ncbi:sensor histidine kinase [Chryseosolibacter indicus]|uniref:Histidine kinase n=1 Tax=Chryseosolibacter indicus TaxID=2782351 RepID=A0ABS5VMD7_9BACT|nr:histidine kinase [Chryseosolibacter indicus]MBT1702609.1 histidine kinase [Chryseosolibacter indicus]
MQSLFQRKRLLLVHISFWLMYLSFFLYQVSHFRHGKDFEWGRATTFAAVQLLSTMLVVYLNYFIFFPRFLVQQKLWKYLLEFLVPFAIIIFARVHLQRYLIDGYTYQRQYFYSHIYVVELVIVTLFITGFIAMLRFAADWFELMATKREIENERLTAELNFLKAQINPHFLFNTLNNLYYLAYTNSSNTTEVIAKLSQMMRYMIYDSNHDRVPLTKEIEYMENYISLERLRLNNQIPISFDITGDVDRYLIAPFIFITFLENAFKHGVSNTNPKAWVKVGIRLQGNICIYTVENSKITSAKPEAEEKSGIGLQNVQRRLELSYPKRHELKVEDGSGQYKITLTLTLL